MNAEKLTITQERQLAAIDLAGESVRRSLSTLRDAMSDARDLPVEYVTAVRALRSEMRELLDRIDATPVAGEPDQDGAAS